MTTIDQTNACACGPTCDCGESCTCSQSASDGVVCGCAK